MEEFNGPDDFGCRTICFVYRNGDMCTRPDKREAQQRIINNLIKGKRYKYMYFEIDSREYGYMGEYLYSNNNNVYFKQDDGSKICICCPSDMLIHFISVD